MQGRRPGSARRPGGGGKGSRAARLARSRGGSGRSPRAPLEAQPSRGTALQPGSAQGPLFGARPPLVADVSPECAFIIDEPPSPQEGEAGRKGERERAGAGGRGEEEGPGTRYKGGGGGRRRRRRRKLLPARCLAPSLPARLPAAGQCRSRAAGRAPRSGAQALGFNPFRPADARRLGEAGSWHLPVVGVGGDPGSQCRAGPGTLVKSHARRPRCRVGREDRRARPLEVPKSARGP